MAPIPMLTMNLNLLTFPSPTNLFYIHDVKSYKIYVISSYLEFPYEMKLSLKRKWPKLHNEKNEETISIVNSQVYKPVC